MNVNPFSLQLLVFRLTVAAVAFALNSAVLLVSLSSSSRLRFPRHVYWTALSLVNLFGTFQILVEVVAIEFESQLACQVYVLNAGASYSMLLVCLCLSALDRYLAIARYAWYKTNVTRRTTVHLVCLAFGLTYLAVTSPFWTGARTPADCTVNLTHMHCVIAVDLMLGVACCLLHVQVFVESRSAIAQCRTACFNAIPMTRLSTTREVLVTSQPTNHKRSSSSSNRLKGISYLWFVRLGYWLILGLYEV